MNTLATWAMLAAIFLTVGWLLWEAAHPLDEPTPETDPAALAAEHAAAKARTLLYLKEIR